MTKSYTFTIDWEDFGQLNAKYQFGQIFAPSTAIDRQHRILLDLLEEYQVKATFFILGLLAEYRPHLVKEIQERGHEIALHGYYHENLNDISYSRIKEDIQNSKNLVEDIIGQQVFGYRAPFFSLTKNRLATLDILSELGFIYDSSIMPAHISKYGIAGFLPENQAYLLSNNQKIVEIPATTYPIMGKEITISGGSYLRLLPKPLLFKYLEKLEEKGKNIMIYLHPYEFDNQLLEVSDNFPIGHSVSKFKIKMLNLRWNILKGTIMPKVKGILQHKKFKTCLEVAQEIDNLNNSIKLIY